MELNKYKYLDMIITDHTFLVPLDYENKDGKEISIFAREIERKETVNKNLSYLVFFQGGPGYESPRPITDSGWIKRASEEYKVLLLDQRGTGLSNPVSGDLFKAMNDSDLAHYLTFSGLIILFEMLRKLEKPYP